MRNVYQLITDRIISKLEEGTVPWHRPWGVRGMPRSLVSGKDYRGINSFVLSSAGYEALYWLSYKQAKERRGFVKKGQQGYPCVYWNWLEKKDEETKEIKKVPFLRYYTVFNVEQCENIEYPKGDGLEFLFDPIENCERIVEEMPNPPSIRRGGRRARYVPFKDTVEMPKPESFETSESYYSVLFHELAHSTGHEKRLVRPGITEPIVFGSQTYSKEELIAEMGAAFLCGHTGIEKRVIDNSASYIAGWLSRLKNDNRLVVQAAAQAQKAADYILGRKLEEIVEE